MILLSFLYDVLCVREQNKLNELSTNAFYFKK